MYEKICPFCKNKFYSDKCFGDDLARHNDCVMKRTPKEKKEQQRPARTSTPVPEPEHGTAPSFSDSVTEFFYQSWKSGLHSDETSSSRALNQWNHQPNAMLQPPSYTPQVVYVNTVVFQPYMPTSYMQQVGYRPDGTFGVLPNYWNYGGN